MTKRRYPVPGDTAERQARASDPQNSVWVSANAGSGKTHVLSQRVIRLLLQGTDPSKILCLTYTRAAAANMSNRVFASLSDWTMLEDGELAARIAEIEGQSPTAAKLRRARKLFAEALETPGGLKIQTITPSANRCCTSSRWRRTSPRISRCSIRRWRSCCSPRQGARC